MGFNFVFDSFDVIGSRDGEVEAVVLDAIYDSGSPNNLQTHCYSSCAKRVTNEQLQVFGAYYQERLPQPLSVSLLGI